MRIDLVLKVINLGILHQYLRVLLLNGHRIQGGDNAFDLPEHVVIFFDLLMVQIPDDLLQPKVGLVDASVEDRIIACPQRNLRQNNEQAQIPAFYHASHQNR